MSSKIEHNFPRRFLNPNAKVSVTEQGNVEQRHANTLQATLKPPGSVASGRPQDPIATFCGWEGSSAGPNKSYGAQHNAKTINVKLYKYAN